MILLITPSARGQQCADALKAATGSEACWAQNLQEAATCLREETYSAAVIDQFLLETEPEEGGRMLEHLGTAFPVYINFAVTGMERLVREVRSALHRRKREESVARRAVEDQMRSEMRETLTAMLDEFFGNLYHLNAEEEPEDPQYPKAPEFKQRFGPRGALRCRAAGRAAGDLFVAQHAEAEGVHERIAFVRLVEVNLARDGRDAEMGARSRASGSRNAPARALASCRLAPVRTPRL